LLSRDQIIVREFCRKGFLIGVHGPSPRTSPIEISHVALTVHGTPRPGARATWSFRGYAARLRLPLNFRPPRRTCGICLEPVATQSVDPCRHEYCAPCIARARASDHTRCPMCREPIQGIQSAPVALSLTIHANSELQRLIRLFRAANPLHSHAPWPTGILLLSPGDDQGVSLPDSAPWSNYQHIDRYERLARRLRGLPEEPVLGTTSYAYPVGRDDDI
jgi:hypothetical protein